MKIIIPAYQPDHRMLQLIEKIKETSDYEIIIVNDGSTADCASFFEQAACKGCIVLSHSVNLGKGAALKTAFSYLHEKHCTDGLICADCDGQHTWQDIQRIALAIPDHPNSLILGCRKFIGKIPFKSRFGNLITRTVFTLITGNRITDTQTGLRGYGSDLLPWLIGLQGSRYEFEMNQLLDAKKTGYDLYCIPIETIYENNNQGSHFHPVMDSIRVYLPIFKFSLSSLVCGSLDFILLFLFQHLTNNLFYSVILARVASSFCNYLLNKHLVFAQQGKKLISLIQYYLLAVIILVCNYLLLSFLHETLGLVLFLSKLLTEAILFLASYTIQHKFIFKK